MTTFCLALFSRSARASNLDVATLFKVGDMDHDGVLDKTEFTHLLQMLGLSFKQQDTELLLDTLFEDKAKVHQRRLLAFLTEHGYFVGEENSAAAPETDVSPESLPMNRVRRKTVDGAFQRLLSKGGGVVTAKVLKKCFNKALVEQSPLVVSKTWSRAQALTHFVNQFELIQKRVDTQVGVVEQWKLEIPNRKRKSLHFGKGDQRKSLRVRPTAASSRNAVAIHSTLSPQEKTPAQILWAKLRGSVVGKQPSKRKQECVITKTGFKAYYALLSENIISDHDFVQIVQSAWGMAHDQQGDPNAHVPKMRL